MTDKKPVSAEKKAKLRAAQQALWADPEYRAYRAELRNNSEAYAQARAKMSESHKKLWADPAFRQERSKLLRAAWKDNDTGKKAISDKALDRWSDPEFAAKTAQAQSNGAKNRWADPVKRAALMEAQRAARAKRNKL